MQNPRFAELVNGPLSHTLPSLTIVRLVSALEFVVDNTGAQGERALEDFCWERQRKDACLAAALTMSAAGKSQ